MSIYTSGLAGIAAAAIIAADPSTLVCMGTRAAGAPVVVLESGAGNGVETWGKVQPAIAEFARVCAYDRPGLRRHWPNGEPPAAPTPDAVIATLDGALTSAGEQPPYVLVGHSYGGMIVRLYATRFPDRVTGVVLVDSSHEDQMRRFGAPPQVLPSPGSQAVFVGPEVFDLAAMSEALKARPWHTDVPLLVLTRGNAGAFKSAPPPDADALARYEIWLELQRELATRSSHSEQIVAKDGGHYIQNDEPNLVVDGVRRIVIPR
jgi:pimeloyl-ACP methyl ester carboxylesterase